MAKRVLRFTDARIRTLKLETKRYDLYDDGARGLVVTVRPEGSKVFYLVRKIGGRVVRYRLARTDEINVEKARKQATILLGEIASGKNPAEKRGAVRAEMTLGELWELFKERRAAKRSLATDKTRYNLHLKSWARRKLSAIRRADVAALLAKITADSGAIAANRTRALLHTMFEVGIEGGLEIQNPVAGTTRNPERSKQRYLQPDELRRFWQALLAEADSDTREFLQLLLLTGVRSGTLTSAQWNDIDLKDAVWHIPPESMKAGKPLDLPLASRTLKILTERAKLVTPEARFVFPSARTESGHLATVPREGWMRVLTRAKVSGVTPHDLRRTHATYGLAAGIPIEVLGKALGHTPIGGVTAIYAQADLQLVRLAVERTVAAILKVAEAPESKRAAAVLEFPRPAWATQR
jgi:integrase